MKTLYAITKKDNAGNDVYLQENGSFVNNLDNVMLYELETEMRPLNDGEYSTIIYQPEPDKVFE